MEIKLEEEGGYFNKTTPQFMHHGQRYNGCKVKKLDYYVGHQKAQTLTQWKIFGAFFQERYMSMASNMRQENHFQNPIKRHGLIFHWKPLEL